MNNTILFLGILLVVIIVILYNFFYKKESFTNLESFIESNSFNGAKEGYVFKNDSKGLGYYIDN